ncbi:C40 family peptidase [Yinghuangia seranimata]|uniref:C40 family peptidase n=1 Tax=Yinghuangia seranimata TaxID=408067 RepID=UPI00248ACA37|nr:C40 family peptidase [Yinghuangia seranimata]MDI2126115.1 NlpC/P60 family protein [Yinghuangia seranimata]
MASHRRPKKPSKTRVGVITAAAAGVVALSPGVSAHADPALSKDQVKAQINELTHQAEIATEELNGFQEKTEQLQGQVAQVQERIAAEQSDLVALQGTMGAIASAQYRGAGIDPTLQLMLSGQPDEFLRQAAALDQVSSQEANAIQQIQSKKRTLDQERTEASHKLGELEQTRKNLSSKKAEVEQKLQKAQQLLNTLTKAERDAILADDGHGDSTDRASRNDNRQPSTPTTPDAPKTDVPVSERAAAAVAAAAAQIGKPYVYGATGPSSFDCSGLTGWAWRQAGVSLPRTSQAQAGAGRAVSVDDIQPGDLVLYYSGYTHVAIYAGGGQIIHAPKPGTNVRYAPLKSMPIAKVVRVS